MRNAFAGRFHRLKVQEPDGRGSSGFGLLRLLSLVVREVTLLLRLKHFCET